MVLNPRCEVWQYFDNIVEEGVAVCKLCKQRLKNERSYSLRKHIKKLHNPKSEIWNHFDNIVDEGVAVCKICNKRVRNNRHFNLLLHLKQHDIVVDVPDNENSTKTTSKHPHSSGQSGVKTVERVRGNLYIDMDEKTLVGAVMGLMIEEDVAPRLFASRNMQELINPVCDAISKQEFTKFKVDEFQSERVISLVANHITNEFCNDLHWRLLPLKLDMDVNDATNSCWVSVQFINDGEMESRNLGVITLNDNQPLTKQKIMEILYKFNIDSNQIVSACWDKTKSNIKRLISNSEYLKEMEKFEKNSDIFLDAIKLEPYVGSIAQLCLFDVLKVPSIFRLFLQCRNLVKFINYNTNIFEVVFEQNKLKIPHIDSPWKCGSTYSMMNDLQLSYAVLKDLKFEQPNREEDAFYLNENLKNFIDAFLESLNLIQKSIHKYYNEEMSFGDFYAQWLKCKLMAEKHLKANCNSGAYLEVFLKELLRSIEIRSNALLNQNHFKACLYLDPRFQHTLNMTEKMFALEYLKQLWERAKIYNAEIVDPVTEPPKLKLLPQQRSIDIDDEDACLNEFLCQGVQDTESTGIYKKLEELKLTFQPANTNILTFWNELKFSEPEIYILSTVCFAIPATQSFEKIHHTQLNNSPDATTMPSYLRANLTLIRLNHNFLNKAIETLRLFREEDLSDDSDDNTSESKSIGGMPISNEICITLPSTSTNGAIATTLTDFIAKTEIFDSD